MRVETEGIVIYQWRSCDIDVVSSVRDWSSVVESRVEDPAWNLRLHVCVITRVRGCRGCRTV